MTFDEKLEAAKTFLASKGIWRASYAPTMVAFLWRLGVKIPPPHFAGFFGVVLFSGTVFGVAWGSLMWLLRWSRTGLSPSAAAGFAALAGLVFGLGMATYYRYAARIYAIPSWDRFTPSDAHLDHGQQSATTR
jgi:hypothetical protein